MDTAQSRHLARILHLRQSFAEANERLVARMRKAGDEAARQSRDGGWSAAQIGWHVAAVTTSFAAIMTGDRAAAHALPADFREREWSEIAAAVPSRLTAPPPAAPPAVVECEEAVA